MRAKRRLWMGLMLFCYDTFVRGARRTARRWRKWNEASIEKPEYIRIKQSSIINPNLSPASLDCSRRSPSALRKKTQLFKSLFFIHLFLASLQEQGDINFLSSSLRCCKTFKEQKAFHNYRKERRAKSERAGEERHKVTNIMRMISLCSSLPFFDISHVKWRRTRARTSLRCCETQDI